LANCARPPAATALISVRTVSMPRPASITIARPAAEIRSCITLKEPPSPKWKSTALPGNSLLIDIGRSINPGVDRGQTIGGFIQGMGWVTAECLVYSDQGALLSHSPTTYKIPAITDVPPIFNCAFFPNDDNVENVARSKAVGEPPLMHAICVWSAVKHALANVAGGRSVDLCLPATGEEILRCLTALEPTPTAREWPVPVSVNGNGSPIGSPSVAVRAPQSKS
jgi:xanthine dehydrogenase large subunit